MNTSAWTPIVMGKASFAPWRYPPLVQPLERGEGVNEAFFIGAVMKTCTKCGMEKEKSAFNKRSKSLDGYQPRCRECMRVERDVYYSLNKTKVLDRNREYAEKNKTRVNLVKKQWRIRNPEKVLAYAAKATPSPSEIKRVRVLNHQAKVGGVKGRLSRDIVIKLLQQQNNCCAACKLPFIAVFHVDHKVPISKEGPNTDDNIQLLHPLCNARKGVLTNEEFLRRLNGNS